MAGADGSLVAEAWQVLLPGFVGTRVHDSYAALFREGLGGVCLYGSNTAEGPTALRTLTRRIRRLRPQAVIAVDEEGGEVSRLYADAGSPVLGAAALGAAGDVRLSEATGRAVAARLAAVGVDLDLAPVADVNSNPDNPVIGTRSFSADPEVAAQHVAAWVRGLQAGGVAGCVKHFPGHGDTGEDSHLALPVLEVGLAQLERREWVPFRAGIAAGTAAVMTSHIVIPELDPELPGTLSAPVLALLRDRLGYDGVVVTDALDMAGASRGRGIPAAAVLALGAGADLLCLGPDTAPALVRETHAAILAAVAEGRLPATRLRRAAARVSTLTSTGVADAGEDAPLEGDPVESIDPAQLAGARSALTATGELPDLTGASVVSVPTTANIAVGAGAWGIEPDVVVQPGDGLPAGRPLVVQVRDARRPELAATLAGLGRGDVLVDWGWPDPENDHGNDAVRIWPHGFSRPGRIAVEELLGEAGWMR